MDDFVRGVEALTLIAVIAALAPFISAVVPGNRLPQSVVMILGGTLIGEHGLGVADRAEIGLFENVGLSFLFLLAGYELDPRLLRERPGRLAVAGWVASTILAAGAVGLLDRLEVVHAFVPVALALTTTAMGTLLPILRETDLLRGPLGRHLLAAGSVGEILPIIGTAVFLGANNRLAAIVSLLAIGLLAAGLVVLPRLLRASWLRRVLASGTSATAQTVVRCTVALLLILVDAAAETGLDVVLGALLAGVVLRRWAPDTIDRLGDKLDVLAYGVFIPVFLIASGMGLDWREIVEDPLRVGLFLMLLLVVRGLPALVIYRRELPVHQRVRLALLTATSLPLLVALTEIGRRSGTMLPANAAAIVGAGVLSVLIFPAVAISIARPPRRR